MNIDANAVIHALGQKIGALEVANTVAQAQIQSLTAELAAARGADQKTED